MDITVADLQHFTTCPRLYWVAKERRNPYMQWFDHFDRCMHLLWTGIALQIQSGEDPSLQTVLKRWGGLYYPAETKERILKRVNHGNRWHDPDRTLFFTGTFAIRSRLKIWKNLMKGIVLAGQEWVVPYRDNRLLGRYDMITQEGKELVLWELRFNTYIPRRSLRTDWEITAAALAFKKDFGRLPDRIRIYEAILGDHHETKRTSGDFSALYDVLDQVVFAINSGISYPAFAVQCEKCPFYRDCYADYRRLVKERSK